MRTRVFLYLPDEISKTPYIRGQGPIELSWLHGAAFKKCRQNEWVWQSTSFFEKGFFMISLGDDLLEEGPWHPLIPGASIQVNPKFPTGALTF